MPRPLLLIHGYSASGQDMLAVKQALADKGIAVTSINVCSYISLNNEITIEDIAEAFDRALRLHSNAELSDETKPFDAIVHSTGMLVLRAWLAAAGPAATNVRLRRLKHLIGLAPATWGSPQAHRGRTWMGALIKGNREFGPDFLNAGDHVLEGLELASTFTWDLAHLDLLGPAPFYDNGPNTPFVAVFIGNKPYDGVSAVANDPGTDGTVRWAGCGLNTRKITMDLTRLPQLGVPRVSISPWANSRLDIPMIAVNDRHHGTLIADPEPAMMQLVADFLRVEDGAAHTAWLTAARDYGAPSLAAMKVNPGAPAGGLLDEAKQYVEQLLHRCGAAMDGWQQFVIRARDEHGDAIQDYMVEILAQQPDGSWAFFEEMYTAVHAFGPDPSYRSFHIRLPAGVTEGSVKLRARIHASSGTDLIGYQGFGSSPEPLTELPQAIEIDVDDLGPGNGTLFYPFTTTLIEIILNRVPLPMTAVSRLLTFL
jgi:hypothetical protein